GSFTKPLCSATTRRGGEVGLSVFGLPRSENAILPNSRTKFGILSGNDACTSPANANKQLTSDDTTSHPRRVPRFSRVVSVGSCVINNWLREVRGCTPTHSLPRGLARTGGGSMLKPRTPGAIRGPAF